MMLIIPSLSVATFISAMAVFKVSRPEISPLERAAISMFLATQCMSSQPPRHERLSLTAFESIEVNLSY